MARNFGAGGPKAAAGSNGASVSEREDLANFISMITRDETPFMSTIGKTKANAILHEWQTDELTVPGLNAQGEGIGYNDVATNQANGPYRTRLGNYCQISSKVVSVSGTKRAVDQAGVADEYAYQLKKRGTELRRDVELSLVHTNQSSNAGTPTTPTTGSTYPQQFVPQSPARTFGGYQGFINFASDLTQANNNSNGLFIQGPTLVVGPNGQVPQAQATAVTNVCAAGSMVITSDGGAPTVANTMWVGPVTAGAGTAGGIGGAEGSFQLTAVDTLMQNIYQNGGKATKMMTSPSNRKAFSARAQAAGASSTGLSTTGAGASNVRRNIDENGSLRQSVEIYMSDFGDIMVVPNYVMGLSYTATGQAAGLANANTQDNFALVYDPMWFNYASLRPLQEVDLGQLGDSIIGQIVEEGSLEVRNPKGCGLIVGLSGS